MFTMAPPPPCLSICCISYFRQSHTPLTLMAVTLSKISSGSSTMDVHFPSMPALLKATSRRPNFSTVLSTNVFTSAVLETSPCRNRTSPPAPRASLAVSLPSSARRPVSTTLAPCRANRMAVSRPIPDVPPVINATLPAKFWLELADINFLRGGCPFGATRSFARSTFYQHAGLAVSGGLLAGYTIDGEQSDCADHRHDEASLVACLVPPDANADESGQERAGDSKEHGNNNSPRVFARHDQLRDCSRKQADEAFPNPVHNQPPRKSKSVSG